MDLNLSCGDQDTHPSTYTHTHTHTYPTVSDNETSLMYRAQSKLPESFVIYTDIATGALQNST